MKKIILKIIVCFLPLFLLSQAPQKKKLIPTYPENYINHSQIEKKSDYHFPEIFEGGKFTTLRKLYVQKDNKINWLFSDKLILLKKPAVSLVKYTPQNSISDSDHLKFYNNELWLYVFDKRISRLMFVFIDDAFDGLIYSGQDNNIDRIGIQYPTGLEILPYIRDDKLNQFEFKLPSGQAIVISIDQYKEYFKTALEELQKEKKPFIPFKNTEIIEEFELPKSFKHNYQNFKYQHKRGKALVFKADGQVRWKIKSLSESKKVALKVDPKAKKMSSQEKKWWSEPAVVYATVAIKNSSKKNLVEFIPASPGKISSSLTEAQKKWWSTPPGGSSQFEFDSSASATLKSKVEKIESIVFRPKK